MDAHRKSIIHGSGQSRWRTDPTMARRLLEIFGCTIDLAADALNTLCPIFLGEGQQPGWTDALAVSWHQCGEKVGFLNPPYSLSAVKALREAGVPATDSAIRSLRIQNWAKKAYEESLEGFTTIGVFPYVPQTQWFRAYVMGHRWDGDETWGQWAGHAALDYWRIPHRVSFLRPDGTPTNNAGVNTCVIHWGPNPGFVGPWVPSGRYWSYR